MDGHRQADRFPASRRCGHEDDQVIASAQQQLRPIQLRVHRPDTLDEENGIAPNTFYTFRVRTTEKKMEIWLDDKRVFSEERDYDLSARRPVRIRTNGSVIDVKSLSVKPAS